MLRQSNQVRPIEYFALDDHTNLSIIKDGEFFEMSGNIGCYFVIYDMDLRMIDGKNRHILLEINTYPNDPRKVVKLISNLHIYKD